MRPTRDQFLLAAGLASVGFGAWLLFAPGTVPALGPLDPLTDADTATRVGLLLGLLVAVLAAFQMRRTARATLDRSDLLGPPPEQAHDAPVPAPSAPLAETYQRLSDRIEQIGRAGWHVAAYGRRARHTTDLSTGDDWRDPPPEPSPPRPQSPSQSQERSPSRPPDAPPASDAGGQQTAPPQPARGYGGPRGFQRQTRADLLALLDDVAVTARDTYATATGCDETTAERAVETGEWTDDRVAAAFLATDLDAPTFTVVERALAWLTPRRTLDRRLERTLDAIEAHADGYLTYRTPSTGADAGERRYADRVPAGGSDDGTSAGPTSGSVPGDATGGGVSAGSQSRDGAATDGREADPGARATQEGER